MARLPAQLCNGVDRRTASAQAVSAAIEASSLSATSWCTRLFIAASEVKYAGAAGCPTVSSAMKSSSLMGALVGALRIGLPRLDRRIGARPRRGRCHPRRRRFRQRQGFGTHRAAATTSVSNRRVERRLKARRCSTVLPDVADLEHDGSSEIDESVGGYRWHLCDHQYRAAGRRRDRNHSQEKPAPEKHRLGEAVLQVPELISDSADEPEKGDAGKRCERQRGANPGVPAGDPSDLREGSSGIALRNRTRLGANSALNRTPATVAARGVLR